MGINFYLHERDACACCGRGYDDLHIGKSSAGWCFALHVIPEEGLNDVQDWQRRWTQDGAVILDEYGDTITPAEMWHRITQREPWRANAPLRRSDIDGVHCVGHGDGTWDLIAGEFS